MENITTQLIEQGILFPNGNICKDKINLMCGVFSTQFVEMILDNAPVESGCLRQCIVLLEGLQSNSSACFSLIKFLYDFADIDMPEYIEPLNHHQTARDYFIFSLILDLEEIASEEGEL